jgi:hypothetical protein
MQLHDPSLTLCATHLIPNLLPGVLPALERDGELLSSSETTDLAVARDLISQLVGRGLNLDRELQAAARADVLAFSQLIQSRLEPATHYTTWLEKRGFQVYRQVRRNSIVSLVHATLPFAVVLDRGSA